MRKIYLFTFILIALVSNLGWAQNATLQITSNATAPVCPGQTVGYTVSPVDGTTSMNKCSFKWTVSGGTFQQNGKTEIIVGNNTNTVSITWNNEIRGIVNVIASSCDESSLNDIKANQYDVKILSIAGQTPKFTSPAGNSLTLPWCSIAPVTLTVEKMIYPSTVNPSKLSEQISVEYYEWTLPSGWTATGGKTGTFRDRNSINVTPQAGATGTISVRAYSIECNLNGGQYYSNPAVLTINRTPTPPTFTTAPPATICNNNSVTVIASAPSASSYNWSLPDGMRFSDGTTSKSSVSGTQTIVAPATGSFSARILVAANYTCTAPASTSPTTSTTVFVGPPTTPSISGGTDKLCVSRSSTYTVNTAGATTYKWTISGGGVIQGSATSPSVSVQATTAGSSIQLVATVSNGCNSPSEIRQVSKTIIVSGAQQLAGIGTINGTSTPIYNNTASYSIASVAGATYYNWVPANGTVVSGQGTERALIRWDIIGPSDLTVIASNECFSLSSSRNITVKSGSTTPCTGTRCPPDPLRVAAEELGPAELTINPNPASDQFTIQGLLTVKQGAKISMYNSIGQLVFQTNIKETKFKLSVQSFPNGVYYFHITQGEELVRQRVIIQH